MISNVSTDVRSGEILRRERKEKGGGGGGGGGLDAEEGALNAYGALRDVSRHCGTRTKKSLP